MNLEEILRADVSAFRQALKGDHEFTGWLSKEVGGNPIAIIGRFSSMFPMAKFVVIARGSRYVVRSIVLNHRRRGIIMSLAAIFKECDSVYRIYEVLGKDGLKGMDAMLLFYEDLVEEPRRELRKVTGFLGMPDGDVYLRLTTLGINAKVDTSSKNTTKVIRSSGSWRNGLTFQEQAVIGAYDLGLAAKGKPSMAKCYSQLQQVIHANNSGEKGQGEI